MDGIWNRSNIWMEYKIGQIYAWNMEQVKNMDLDICEIMDGIGQGPQ